MVNSPLPESLDKECAKAARILKSFQGDNMQMNVDKVIPPDVIENARVRDLLDNEMMR